MNQAAYSTDLSDAQWALWGPFLPTVKRADGRNGRPRNYSYRAILDGIFSLVRAGCAWELLPHALPPSRTGHHYFRKGSEKGWLQRIHTSLREQVRTAQNREPTPAAAIIDSPSIKTTEKGGSPARTLWATTAMRKSKGVNAACS